MTFAQISSMIDEIGYPSAYYHFKDVEPPSVPFVVFYYPQSADVYADGTNYQRITDLTIELYTYAKSFEAEEKVEAVLKAHDISFSKDESPAGEENAWGVQYQMEVLING